MGNVELSPEMERAYSSLVEYATEVATAMRDHTGRASEMANQVLRYRIPEFKKIVPSEIRGKLSYGSHQSLSRIEETARRISPQVLGIHSIERAFRLG